MKENKDKIPWWVWILLIIIIIIINKTFTSQDNDSQYGPVIDKGADPIRPGGNIIIGEDELNPEYQDFDYGSIYDSEVDQSILQETTDAIASMEEDNRERDDFNAHATWEAKSNSSGCPIGCTYHKIGCDIKGNISYNSGEKIYHLPGQEYYYTTKINSSHGERWFCTEAEALANGWRKSQK